MIVAFFESAVNFDIFDVKYCKMGKPFLSTPKLAVLDIVLVFLDWSMLDLHLLLKIVHGVAQLQIVRNVRHFTKFNQEFII